MGTVWGKLSFMALDSRYGWYGILLCLGCDCSICCFSSLLPCAKNVVPPSSAIFEWHECYGQLHAEWWHGRNAVKECLPEISCFPSIFCNLKIKKGLTKINGLTLGFFLPRLFLRSSLPPNRKAYFAWFFGGLLWVIFLLLLLHVFFLWLLSYFDCIMTIKK